MITRRNLLIAPAAALVQCGRRKAAGFRGYAFVANHEGRAVAAVDLSVFAVARHIGLDGRPSAAIAHPVLPSIYVLSPENGALQEITTASLSVRRGTHPARSAVSMRLSADGNSIWVLCREPSQLARVRLEDFRVDGRIPLPFQPVDFDLAPQADSELAAVSFGDSGNAALVHLSRRTTHSFSLGKRLSLVRFRSDGRALLVGNAEQRAISVLDVPTGRAVVHLPLAVRPDNFCFKSDGGQLFVTGEGMDAVAVVYPYTTEVAETVLAGRDPGAMAQAASPEGDYLLVANSSTGEVTVLDIETRRVIAVIGVGQGPAFITVTPDRQYALVLNRLSGDLAVVRIAAIAGRRTRSAPLFTLIPVGSGPVSAAVTTV